MKKTELHTLLFENKNVLLSTCNTLFNSNDTYVVSTFCDYCEHHGWIKEFINWCYDHDFEYGYNQFDNEFFIKVTVKMISKYSANFLNIIHAAVIDFFKTEEHSKAEALLTQSLSAEDDYKMLLLIKECFETITEKIIKEMNLLEDSLWIIDSIFKHMDERGHSESKKSLIANVIWSTISISLSERYEMGKEFYITTEENWVCVGLIADIIYNMQNSRESELNNSVGLSICQRFADQLFVAIKQINIKEIKPECKDEESEQSMKNIMRKYYKQISLPLSKQLKYILSCTLELPEFEEKDVSIYHHLIYKLTTALNEQSMSYLNLYTTLQNKREEYQKLMQEYEKQYDTLFQLRKRNKELKYVIFSKKISEIQNDSNSSSNETTPKQEYNEPKLNHSKSIEEIGLRVEVIHESQSLSKITTANVEGKSEQTENTTKKARKRKSSILETLRTLKSKK